MGRRSVRKQLIEKILYEGLINIIWAKTGNYVDKELQFCTENLLSILSFRYCSPRDIKVIKSRDWVGRILPSFDELRFKSCLRVTRSDFAYLLNLMENSPVFQVESKKMISVEIQLAIALYRFGCDGSGASYWKVGQQFGVSDCGMILNATNRIIKALLKTEKRYITWPDENERKKICSFMEDKLPGCVGYLDGCHIPLFEAPIDHPESYYSRKQEYGIQIQAVCDNDLIIRNMTVGYPASTHDARVLNNSPIGQNPQNFFSEGQWLAADSAYRLTASIITPFRENATYGTLTQRKAFNRHFSGYRVKIEQTFGILKKFFGSLRQLRVRVDNKSGHRRACQWIRACCVVYNIIKPTHALIEVDDDYDDDEQYYGQDCNRGEERRRDLFNWINGL